MAITFSADFEEYTFNEYFYKRLDKDKILLTTKHGGWAVLSEDEFKKLRHGEVEKDINLFNLLKQEGIIITEKNTPRIVDFYKSKYEQLFQGTTLHIITPTLRCNHKCVYCYASSRPLEKKEYDMNEETAKAVVDFIFQCSSPNITIEFQGGEPLLNFPIIKFITDYANKLNKGKEKNVGFRLVTNLTYMDDEKLDFLMKNNYGLNTSLDGPKEIHNKNRKYENGKGSYVDVVKWIKELKKGGINISTMPTITKQSLQYWKEIIDEYVDLGLNRFWARRLNIGGVAVKNWKKIGYTPDEFLDFWRKSVEYIFELNKKGVKIQEGYVEIVARNVLFSKKYNSFVCMASPCGCAWSQVAYDYKGDIYTCDEARSFDIFKLGNVKKLTYKEVYTSSEVLDIIGLSTGLSFDCVNCVYHPFCGPCIVDNFGEHGNIIQRPNNFNCKTKKGMLDYIFKEVIPNEERLRVVEEWIGIKEKEPAQLMIRNKL